jgi:hypothetical protein
VNSLRAWVLILAVVCFGAGLAAGVLSTATRLRAEPTPGPFDAYRARLVETFGLSPERDKALRTVLAAYQKDIEELQSRHGAEILAAMEPDLRERGRYYRDLIQDKVLPEEQRPLFERLALGLPATPSRR